MTRDAIGGQAIEQQTLPFGTAIGTQQGAWNNRRFTSYDRSVETKLDYAVNRFYSSAQGRFTQVDPIGIAASSLENPQSLNLYAYVGNDPINQTDPDGLFWKELGSFFSGVGKIFSAVGKAMARVLNNKWVRLATIALDFIMPGFSGVLRKIIGTALKYYNVAADIAGELQLAGMMLQGQWKELGVTLGFGVIGSYVSVVIDNMRIGARSVIAYGQFDELADLFVGAAKGLKRGFANLRACLFGRGAQALIPCYGNYGGPGYGIEPKTRVSNNGDPVDGLDEYGFNDHDHKYDLTRETLADNPDIQKGYYDGDKKLVKGMLLKASYSPRVRALDIALGTGPTIGSRYKFMATVAFLGVMVYRRPQF
jgi:RHS repeat-associated protein